MNDRDANAARNLEQWPGLSLPVSGRGDRVSPAMPAVVGEASSESGPGVCAPAKPGIRFHQILDSGSRSRSRRWGRSHALTISFSPWSFCINPVGVFVFRRYRPVAIVRGGRARILGNCRKHAGVLVDQVSPEYPVDRDAGVPGVVPGQRHAVVGDRGCAGPVGASGGEVCPCTGLVLQSQIMVKMSEASLVVAVAGSGLMASSPTGPGQHRFL